jgi:hypothetical protein
MTANDNESIPEFMQHKQSVRLPSSGTELLHAYCRGESRAISLHPHPSAAGCRREAAQYRLVRPVQCSSACAALIHRRPTPFRSSDGSPLQWASSVSRASRQRCYTRGWASLQRTVFMQLRARPMSKKATFPR